jgi:hypothetical protein
VIMYEMLIGMLCIIWYILFFPIYK